MPRKARIVLAGYPHHVIHRGHNRNPVFVHEDDYRFFLRMLGEWKIRFQCKVYAYCLMTNHVHLIIAPGDDVSNLGKLMKRLAGRFTRYINRAENRTGTVWNGRFKSSPIETDSYFMACCRYVELNPVRAGMVAAPEQYRWSSHVHRVTSQGIPWLDEHSIFTDLGTTPSRRRQRYRAWVSASIPEKESTLIRVAVQRGQLTGGVRFQKIVEKRLGIRVECRGPGRPQVGKK